LTNMGGGGSKQYTLAAPKKKSQFYEALTSDKSANTTCLLQFSGKLV